MTASLLSAAAASARSSAIRDLLEHAGRPGMISLAGGLPDPTLFPAEGLARIASEVIREDRGSVLQYGETAGHPECAQLLATLFDDPVERVVVTTGSQQGLDLLIRTLVDPGDVVMTSDPEYVGLTQLLRGAGARHCAVAVDDDGIDTEHIANLLADGVRPKACYVSPHFHNPSGSRLSADRRSQLHQLSAHYGFVVIEDDPYRELHYDGERPTEASADPSFTVRLRSTSKTLTPGLRVGVMAGPDWLLDAVVRAKQFVDLHTSTLSQAVVARAIHARWYPEHVAHLRTIYATKRDTLIAGLDNVFGDRMALRAPGGGMFVWADFGDEVDTTAWLHHALVDGVCFVPGSAFLADDSRSGAVRLSFCTATTRQLGDAIDRLASSLARARAL
ncbi:MAG: PLP-dependent aminotransferase family protein [Acidimicrobiales bacterium]